MRTLIGRLWLLAGLSEIVIRNLWDIYSPQTGTATQKTIKAADRRCDGCDPLCDWHLLPCQTPVGPLALDCGCLGALTPGQERV